MPDFFRFNLSRFVRTPCFSWEIKQNRDAVKLEPKLARLLGGTSLPTFVVAFNLFQ